MQPLLFAVFYEITGTTYTDHLNSCSIILVTSLAVLGKGILQQAQAINIGRQCNVNIDNQMPTVGDMYHGEFDSCSLLRCPLNTKKCIISQNIKYSAS